MDKKRGCHGCKYADWDADGATCKLDGLNVWNPVKGCKYRKAQSVTNGDIIRKMTDHEIAAALSDAVRSGIAGGQNDTYEQWLEWLRKEAEP